MTLPHADRPDPTWGPAVGVSGGGTQRLHRWRGRRKACAQTDLPDPIDLGPLTELDARKLGWIRRFFAVHPRVMDFLICGIYGFVMAAGNLMVGMIPSEPPWLAAATLLGTGATTVALYWRRRAPLIVTALVTLISCLQTAAMWSLPFVDIGDAALALPLAIYAVAAARPPRVAWPVLVTACGVISALFATSILNLESSGSLGDLIANVIAGVWVLPLIAMAIGNSVRSRREHVANLVERTNALVRDRDQRAKIAVIDERTRIAREMHDIVAHSLTVMIALADGAKTSLDRDPDLSRNALTELSGTGRAALGDMRRLLGVLRESDDDDPVPLAPTGWDSSLEEVLGRFRAAGLTVRFRIADMPGTVDAAVRYTVRRILLESLTNALRYAPGSQVDVSVSCDHGTLVVVIANGLGTAAAPSSPVGAGRGIVGMRERTAMYGGTLEAGPTEAGWRVRAEIPLDDRAGGGQ